MREGKQGFLGRLFGKTRQAGEYEISINRVHDRVVIREGDEALHLVVESDPMRMVTALTNAQARFSAWGKDTTEERKQEDVRVFAEAIFGEKQTEELFEFYHGDSSCVMNVCSSYFDDRLARKVTDAQKKALDAVKTGKGARKEKA